MSIAESRIPAPLGRGVVNSRPRRQLGPCLVLKWKGASSLALAGPGSWPWNGLRGR